MKSPPAVPNDDCDDIFGPPRTYPTGYSPPKNRPSMISAKYRQKEERRKVLKISINKLKKIEDPEASLCRSVLINNTMKKLQKEARDEKVQKQQLNYPRCYDNDNYLNLKSEFLKNEPKSPTSYEESTYLSNDDKLHVETFSVEGDFDAKLVEGISEVNAKNIEVLGNLVEENLNSLTDSFHVSETLPSEAESNDRFSMRKRSFDDMEECDVQDVLSQFYMPPTPRMLTCFDDDEDVNVVDDEPLPKRLKVEMPSSEEPSIYCNRLEMDKMSDKTVTDFSVTNFLNNNIHTSDSRLRYLSNNQSADTDSNAYSCGHASMFSELQSNVYHNLIASLET